MRFSSEGWKNFGLIFRGLEKSGGFFPDVGKFSISFSEHWKNWSPFFQTLEGFLPRVGTFAAKRGLAGACACVGLRFLPGEFSTKLVQGLLKEDYLAPAGEAEGVAATAVAFPKPRCHAGV